MTAINIRQWRVINTIIIVGGLFMPWIVFNFDIQIANQQIDTQSGWNFFFLLLLGIIDDLLMNGFEVRMLPLWVESFLGILLFLYLIFSVLAALKNRKHEKNRVVSIGLVAMVIVFLLPVLIGGTPFLGYWLMNLGILSSAVLEWQ
jgi:uncharacterized membrane protein (DUF373 family)